MGVEQMEAVERGRGIPTWLTAVTGRTDLSTRQVGILLALWSGKHVLTHGNQVSMETRLFYAGLNADSIYALNSVFQMAPNGSDTPGMQSEPWFMVAPKSLWECHEDDCAWAWFYWLVNQTDQDHHCAHLFDVADDWGI